MSFFNINKFKGLRQDVDYPELPTNYCHVLKNINVDDPVGRLTIREGYAHKYDIAAFTNIISAYEYRFEVSGETVVILNDNGTLKTITDGAAAATLTLPTGATLESGFKNQYMGYKDHILVTTGNGATNYMLWFGYVDREIDDNKGLFGNVEEKTGYILTKSQLITPHGMFYNVRDMVYVGGYYWLSFTGSANIEKRDENFRLIERRNAYVGPVGATTFASANGNVSLATDGTYLYMACNTGDDPENLAWAKIDPEGYAYVDGAGSDVGYTTTVVGIATDGTETYIATNNRLFTASSGFLAAEDTLVSATGIACDNTATTGRIFILYTGSVDTRDKDDLTTIVTTDSTNAAHGRIVYQDNGVGQSYVFISSTTGDGHVYRHEDDDITTITDYTNVDAPNAMFFLLDVDANIRAISTEYGTVEEIAAADTEYPQLVGITCTSKGGTGSLVAGTYFYKISIEDWDGQYYTLSDPIVIQNTAGTTKHQLRLICHKDQLTDNSLYRVKNIHIFRAYSGLSNGDSTTPKYDQVVPTTDYKFLAKIDINSANWVEDSDQEVYYYDHTDNTTEDIISTTTFLGTSGIGDSVMPRYINGKYITWLDNKLHLANFHYDGDPHRNRIIRSADNNPDGIAFYDYYDFDVGDGEQINGISEVYGRSVVFKNRKFGVFYNGILEKTHAPGLASVLGYHKTRDTIYFISDVGLHAFDGGEIKNIHYPVGTYFDALTTLSDGAVFFVDSKDRVIFTFDTDDVAFVYNIKYGL
jgi:hypothetical protein